MPPVQGRYRELPVLALLETIRLASLKSRFYARHPGGLQEADLNGLDGLSRLPFTTAEHI
jgi:hypothetical protein